MEEFTSLMRQELITALPVCHRKCIISDGQSTLNKFEENCIGKCVDTFIESYYRVSTYL
jgi:hypothetical protein